MKQLLLFFIAAVPFLSNLSAQNRTLLATDPFVYAVCYIEVTPASRSMAVAAFKQYGEASRKEKGNVRFDVLQNAMRLNHFTIIEAWQGQDAVDAHALTAQTREYRNTIQPVLGSPLDERLFKAVD